MKTKTAADSDSNISNYTGATYSAIILRLSKHFDMSLAQESHVHNSVVIKLWYSSYNCRNSCSEPYIAGQRVRHDPCNKPEKNFPA